MAITLGTVAAGSLIVDVIDTNLAAIDTLLKEQVTESEFKDSDFDRYLIRRWTGGRVVSITTASREVLDVAVHRSKSRNANDWDVSGYRTLHDLPASVLAGSLKSPLRELLGSPGRSFFYDFQEDGYSNAGVTPDAASVAVDNEDQSEPVHECHSWWLTVPHGSLRQWVPEPCVAMVWADFSVIGAAMNTILSAGLAPNDPTAGPADTFRPDLTAGHDDSWMFRTGLFVDHNPCPNELTYEFANANPNLVHPVSTGVTSGTKSWEMITDKGIQTNCRTTDRLRGVIPLDGNRFYNFSLKYRDGLYRGYKYNYGGDSGKWTQSTWDLNATMNPETGYNGLAGASRGSSNQLPLDLWWENVTVHVEFFYGRDSIQSDFTNAEFTTVP